MVISIWVLLHQEKLPFKVIHGFAWWQLTDSCSEVSKLTHAQQSFLELLRINCAAAVCIDGHEVLPPAIQHGPELFKFIEAQSARHVSLDYG